LVNGDFLSFFPPQVHSKATAILKIVKKVKLSRYRPREALGVAGG
jgi:hypothetical protein